MPLSIFSVNQSINQSQSPSINQPRVDQSIHSIHHWIHPWIHPSRVHPQPNQSNPSPGPPLFYIVLFLSIPFPGNPLGNPRRPNPINPQEVQSISRLSSQLLWSGSPMAWQPMAKEWSSLSSMATSPALIVPPMAPPALPKAHSQALRPAEPAQEATLQAGAAPGPQFCQDCCCCIVVILFTMASFLADNIV